jgi:hypothetical protein
MSDKFLIRIAIAAFATLLLALGAVGAINYFSPKTDSTTSLTQQEQPAPAKPAFVVRESQTSNSMTDVPAQVHVPQFNQPISKAVTASELKNLALQVNLTNIKASASDKEQWQKAIPKAQELLSGACDCEQRNWLTHFVEAGNDAVSGDNQFEDTAKFLATLPHDDSEATTHVSN